MAQRHVFFITRNQANAAAGAAAGPGAGANAEPGAGAGAGAAAAGQQAAMQRARVIVTRLFRQLAAQRQGQAAEQAGAGGTGAGVGAGAVGEPQLHAAAQPGNNATAAVAIAFGNLRRLPLVGRWLQHRQQFTTVRRVFLGQGHGPGQMMHVRVQRINMADIPGLQTRAAAAAAAAATAAAAAATAAATAAAAAANAAATAAAATLTATATSTASTTGEDVESNHGQGRCEAPATTTTTTTTMNSINDAGATEQEMAATQDGNKKLDEAEAGETAEATQDKQLKVGNELGQDLGQAGVDKMLKNLNSATADIINMPDTTAATITTSTTTAKTTTTTTTTRTESLGLPLAKQLANNLPAQVTQKAQETMPSSGEKQSSPVQLAQSNFTDQQRENQATTTTTTGRETSAASTSKQSRADDKAEQESKPDAGFGSRFTSGLEIEAMSMPNTSTSTGTSTGTSTMMDGRQTVDFIEGDSFTSTANYDDVDAAANHVDEKQQGVQGELMKTSPHTSNHVTRAAEAAAANN
ncbi:hypothetical protein ACLKA6_007728 [Drosophila palustris]